MTETSTTTDTTFAEKLTVVIDLLNANPDLPRPCVFAYGESGSVEVTWQLMHNEDTKDDQRAVAQTIIRTIGGKWDKAPWDDRFDFHRTYRGIKLQIYAHRDQLCERIVTGTETVTVPAVEAKPERTETHEVVEWRCTPLLGDADEQVSA